MHTIFSLSMPGSTGSTLRSQVREVVQQVQAALGFEPEVEFIGLVDAGVPSRFTPHVVACVRERFPTGPTRPGEAVLVQLNASDESLASPCHDGVGDWFTHTFERANEHGRSFQTLERDIRDLELPKRRTRIEWTCLWRVRYSACGSRSSGSFARKELPTLMVS